MTTDEALDIADRDGAVNVIGDTRSVTGLPYTQVSEAADVLAAEVRRLREERDVYEPAAKNWPAMLKRYERAEADLAAARDRATTAEASYQEAQLRLAGLEAERDHYRAEAARLRALLEAGER